jgi:DNA-binding NtrC family response regulator
LIDAICQRDCHLAFIDLELEKGRLQGRDVVRQLKTAAATGQLVPPLVIVTAYPDTYSVEEALKDGVYEYFRKESLAKADGDYQESEDEARRGIKAFIESHFDLPSLYHYDDTAGEARYGITRSERVWLDKTIVGRSPAMLRLKAQLAAAARSDLPVLLTGASGTGKELAAETIHRLSDRGRAHYNWVAVNCAAFTKDLMASELFGHIKGAFTGATADKAGLLAEANRSTLFLDEIGHASEQFQSMLLRALSTKKARLVGSNSEFDFDVRLIAATDRSIRDVRFEKSFLYRLAGICIEIPPLCERLEDISNEALLGHIVGQYRAQIGKERIEIRFTKGAILRLQRYSWPGNVRELGHIVRASCDSVLRRSDLGNADDIVIDAAYVDGLLKQALGSLSSTEGPLATLLEERSGILAILRSELMKDSNYTYKAVTDAFAALYVHYVHFHVLHGDRTTNAYEHTARYLQCSASTVKQRLAEWEQNKRGPSSNVATN